ncbi:unnamed protein product [Closterium sp. Yama58-4]|nr:unnamed protein product [Closterium sp. Yama58-4]
MGQRTCLHLHGALPYFYVPYDDDLPQDIAKDILNVNDLLRVPLHEAGDDIQMVPSLAPIWEDERRRTAAEAEDAGGRITRDGWDRLVESGDGMESARKRRRRVTFQVAAGAEEGWHTAEGRVEDGGANGGGFKIGDDDNAMLPLVDEQVVVTQLSQEQMQQEDEEEALDLLRWVANSQRDNSEGDRSQFLAGGSQEEFMRSGSQFRMGGSQGCSQGERRKVALERAWEAYEAAVAEECEGILASAREMGVEWEGEGEEEEEDEREGEIGDEEFGQEWEEWVQQGEGRREQVGGREAKGGEGVEHGQGRLPQVLGGIGREGKGQGGVSVDGGARGKVWGDEADKSGAGGAAAGSACSADSTGADSSAPLTHAAAEGSAVQPSEEQQAEFTLDPNTGQLLVGGAGVIGLDGAGTEARKGLVGGKPRKREVGCGRGGIRREGGGRAGEARRGGGRRSGAVGGEGEEGEGEFGWGTWSDVGRWRREVEEMGDEGEEGEEGEEESEGDESEEGEEEGVVYGDREKGSDNDDEEMFERPAA